MEVGYELTDSEIESLLKIIKDEVIEPHYEACSLHVQEGRYIVGNIEYVFYYGIGDSNSLPLVEVLKINE